MGSVKRRYSKEEFARRGDTIYENDVRPHLKPADDGKFAAIDIESGTYELARDELTAGNKLRTRIPEAQIWMVGASAIAQFIALAVGLGGKPND